MQFILATAAILASLSAFVGATPVAREECATGPAQVYSLALPHHAQFTES